MSIRIPSIKKQYKKCISGPDPHMKFLMCDDIGVWYILFENILGDEDEYKGGQYLAKFTMPDEFPYKPPQFQILTPNGLYDIEGKVCVSIGEFHSNQYPAVLGINGFAKNLVSGWIGWKLVSVGESIGILYTDVATKRELAEISSAYNEIYYADIIAQINDNYAEYSRIWST